MAESMAEAVPGGAGRARELVTIPDIFPRARAALSAEVWDYATGGGETESTLRRNRLAIEAITFRPRVLRDVSRVDLDATFLGHPLALPVMLAPVGNIALFDPAGAAAQARVAGRAGTIAWISTMSQPSLEEVAAAAGGPLVFQLYVRDGREWTAEIVGRAEAAGYRAICLTVDTAVYGRRERDMRNRFRPRSTARPNLGGVERDHEFAARFTWEEADWLRGLTRLPLIVKGITSAADAALAVEHGFQAVVVSNHGGRQLDYAPATIEALPEIVAAVDGRAEVVVDGGFVRGTDVLKAVALGARAVLVGKLMVLSLAAGGEAALTRALELLAEEMGNALALLGERRLADLAPACLRLPRFDSLVVGSELPWLQ